MNLRRNLLFHDIHLQLIHLNVEFHKQANKLSMYKRLPILAKPQGKKEQKGRDL